MKLQTVDDLYSFLSEVERPDLADKSPEDIPSEVFELFLKRRKGIVPRLKDFRKSQATKSSWNKHRWKYLKGIKKFARSIRGKRLHRSLGRFVATRYSLKTKTSAPRRETLELVKDLALKALPSLRTHMYIEQGYYMSLSEQVESELFMDYALPILRDVEERIYEDITYELEKDELELLLRLIEEKELCKALAEVLNIDVNEVEKIWTQSAENQKEESTYFLSERFKDVVEQLGGNNEGN